MFVSRVASITPSPVGRSLSFFLSPLAFTSQNSPPSFQEKQSPTKTLQRRVSTKDNREEEKEVRDESRFTHAEPPVPAGPFWCFLFFRLSFLPVEFSCRLRKKHATEKTTGSRQNKKNKVSVSRVGPLTNPQSRRSFGSHFSPSGVSSQGPTPFPADST